MTEKQELIATPKRTQEILRAHGFTFKKSLGQNFLTRPELLQQMVAAADLQASDQVLEIGPGIGALTELLAQKAEKVVALEIDQRLLPILADTLSAYHNVTVLNQDVLKVDLPKLFVANFDLDRPIKVLANLPYYITTPILLKLIHDAPQLAKIVVMMQQEVAERIVAVPGHKSYGSLTLAVQMSMAAKIEFKVPKTAFVPQPKVDSAIVSLSPIQSPMISVAQRPGFNAFILSVFKQRRKRLLNNLLFALGKTDENKQRLHDIFQHLNLSEDIRAEALSLQQFKTLYDELLKNGYNFR